MHTLPTRATTHQSAPAVPVRRPRAAARHHLAPWLFLAPALVVLAVFKFWPTLSGIVDSFYDVRPYLGNRWVGTANFDQAFHDPGLRIATWHTLLDAAVTVTASLVIGLGLALLLQGEARHLRIIRTAILPVRSSASSTSGTNSSSRSSSPRARTSTPSLSSSPTCRPAKNSTTASGWPPHSYYWHPASSST